VELYLQSPNTPSWCGAQLNHRDNFTFTFTANIVLEKLNLMQINECTMFTVHCGCHSFQFMRDACQSKDWREIFMSSGSVV